MAYEPFVISGYEYKTHGVYTVPDEGYEANSALSLALSIYTFVNVQTLILTLRHYTDSINIVRYMSLARCVVSECVPNAAR